jgi:peptidoglycan/LPS O-acetylase OafA/YrhL
MSYVDKSIHILSPGKSDFLNLVRWAAALVVVLGHADMYLGQFGGNPERWASFGYLGAHSHAAVMVFFVLSGYVVAYATGKKAESGGYGFRAYFLDRWSRIYSVLLLAIVFTLAIDFVGGSLSLGYRDPSLIPQSGFALRLFTNIFALQGIQGYRIQLGSNPALWSIGYEFIFYLMYGLLFFKRQLFRRSWVAPLIFIIALVLIGWKMAVYFGVWLMGVLAYRVTSTSPLASFKIRPWLLLLTLSAANHLINFTNGFGLPEIIRDMLFAGVIAALLVVDCPPPQRGLTPVNAYLAEFSYSLYAFHMPLIFFLCSLFFTRFFQHLPRFFPGILLALACLVVGRILFTLGESRRVSYRQFGDRALTRLAL